MSTRINRAIAAAAAASIALTGLGLTSASAAPFYGPRPQAAPVLTDVGYRHGGDGAAALGAFAAIAGTIATIAATQHHRDAYYDGPAYAYGPAPYGYAPGWGGWRGHWHRH
jgi:hypothetical protein